MTTASIVTTILRQAILRVKRRVELEPGQVRSLVRRLGFAPAPLSLFQSLTANGGRADTILLESADPDSRRPQKSVLVLSSALSVTCRADTVTLRASNPNGQSLIPFLARQLADHNPVVSGSEIVIRVARSDRTGSDRERLLARSVLSPIREILRSLCPETADLPEALFLAGVFAYDLVAQYEDLPEPAADTDFPDYQLLLADQLVVIDHLLQRADVIVNVFGGEHADASEVAAAAALSAVIDAARSTTAPRAPANSTASVTVDCDDAAYCATVVSLKQHIIAGDVFQIVPSRTFSLACTDPLAAYAALRELDPSPYLFFVNTGDFVLFGASPESAVKVDGPSRRVEICPIAGTRPRGLRDDGTIDRDLDGRYEAELRLDAKETAEHMMLVDLARNDVARVSRPGSRHVPDLMSVERFAHVMHLVSRVRGELAVGLDALHAYQASMNMGTLTGAPKIRAMQLLRQYEPGRRGHYGGAIGYLSGNGSLDTAVVIRAALVVGGIAHVRAGAGVVHDSVPQLEADETRRKAEAVLRAIKHAG